MFTPPHPTPTPHPPSNFVKVIVWGFISLSTASMCLRFRDSEKKFVLVLPNQIPLTGNKENQNMEVLTTDALKSTKIGDKS